MTPTVYLAGPVAGATRAEANDWRDELIPELAWHGIAGVSPLRCEPPAPGADRYELDYPDPMFGTARAISSKNMYDVRRCDFLLVRLPDADIARPSYGSICELAWARMLDKPTILVTRNEYLRRHPVIGACASWVLDDLDAAIDVLVGVLRVYRRKTETGGMSR